MVNQAPHASPVTITAPDGLPLAAESHAGDRGSVLLAHGFGQTRQSWAGPQCRLARAGHPNLSWDMRGHGRSGRNPAGTPYRPEQFVDDVLCVARTLPAKPVLVGASMGGGTSLVAIGEDRVDATALVLVDVGPRIEPAGVSRIHAFMDQRPEGFASLEEVADAIASYQPQRKRPKTLDGLAKNMRLADDGKYRWHWDPRFRMGVRDLEKRHERMEACARALTLPTLMVRGGLSDLLSEENARDFLAMCPHSEFVNVGGAGHMVAGDRNDNFADAVVEFLSRTVPVGGAPKQPAHTIHPHHEGPPGPINDIP